MLSLSTRLLAAGSTVAPCSRRRQGHAPGLLPRRRPEPCRAQAGADRDAFPAARLAAPHAACDDACATLSYDDWQQGYECAACWHVEDADPALPLQPGERLHLRPSHREVPHPVPTRRPAAMAAHLTVASYVEASAEEAGEGLSDLEEWVFSSACEAAACWQAELAHGAGGAVAGAVAPAAGAARSTNGGRATVKPDGDGPMDQDALEAWRHAAKAAGAHAAAEPGGESLLASVDGMVGNWEALSASQLSSDEAQDAALAGVAQVMAQLHQLEEQAGLADALAARAAAAWRGAAPPCSLDFSE